MHTYRKVTNSAGDLAEERHLEEACFHQRPVPSDHRAGTAGHKGDAVHEARVVHCQEDVVMVQQRFPLLSRGAVDADPGTQQQQEILEAQVRGHAGPPLLLLQASW